MDWKSTGGLVAAQEIRVKLEVRNLKGSQALQLCFSPISSDAVICTAIRQKRLTAEFNQDWGFTNEHNNVREGK